MKTRSIADTVPYTFDKRQTLDETTVKLRRMPMAAHYTYIHWMVVLKALGAGDDAWGTTLN